MDSNVAFYTTAVPKPQPNASHPKSVIGLYLTIGLLFRYGHIRQLRNHSEENVTMSHRATSI